MEWVTCDLVLTLTFGLIYSHISRDSFIHYILIYRIYCYHKYIDLMLRNDI